MSTHLPFACTLTATEMPIRLAEMSAIGNAALLSAEVAHARATLRFCPDGDTPARLAAIVADESDCCAFLPLVLREQPDFVELVIAAPPGAEPVLGSFVQAFRGEAQPA